MRLEIKVPSVGESVTQGQIAAWLSQDGAIVKTGEPLFELESEKASMTVSAPAGGRLSQTAAVGAEVAIGQIVAYIETETGTATGSDRPGPGAESKSSVPERQGSPAPPKTASPVPPPGPAPAAQASPGGAPIAGAAPPPSTPIPEAPATSLPPASSVPPGTAKPQDVTRTPLTMMRKTIARRLVQARQESAHLTTFNEVDMEELLRIRKVYGEDFQAKYRVKLGFMSFFVKAAVRALQEYPVVNSRIEGDELVSPGFYDIGVAVSTERGLLVPVLRNADRMSSGDIESALADLAARSRDRRIELSELQGGTFTITNGGVFGSMLSTPIPNYPQSAILGMHSIQRRPIAVGDEVVIKPMMYLALTYDHRLIDGREAVLFLIKIKECIEDPERLILGL